MGLVAMSAKDLQRIEVLTEVLAGRRSVAFAATVLAISERQAYRLLARYQENGGSDWCIRPVVAPQTGAVAQVSASMPSSWSRLIAPMFGPTLATEALAERACEPCRPGDAAALDDGRWRVALALASQDFHQPRLRRESYGELVHTDAAEHRWSENRAEPCTLLVSRGRRYEQAHAFALRAQQEHGELLRCATWLSARAWLP